MPGLVSPELPRAFAVPTAYGDLTAVVLALLALGCIRYENAAAVPMLWLFNVAGLLDLIFANLSTFKDHVAPVYLGVSYYLVVLNVPRPCLDFRLLAEADRARMTAAYVSNERHEISERSASCVP